MITFAQATQSVRSGIDLSVDQTSHLIDAMLRGDAAADDPAIGKFLLAVRDKGEAIDELVGAALAMRRHMTRIGHRHAVLLDTCGTGGSGSGTFNISTAVAILTSACGVAVAKHGNRKATSHSGSADVLEHLGVPIQADADAVAATLDAIGVCFCFAAKLHPAMKHVIGIRRALGVPTLFNLLGPLCNPAAATHQLLGTASTATQTKIAAAITRLGTTRSFVLHADDGQDEVSLAGSTRVADVRGGHVPTYHDWTAATFSLPTCRVQDLAAADPAASARIITDLFAGQRGPCRDTVLAGTAAALLLVGRVADLTDGVKLAAAAIDDGAAADQLSKLRSFPAPAAPGPNPS